MARQDERDVQMTAETALAVNVMSDNAFDKLCADRFKSVEKGLGYKLAKVKYHDH